MQLGKRCREIYITVLHTCADDGLNPARGSAKVAVFTQLWGTDILRRIEVKENPE